MNREQQSKKIELASMEDFSNDIWIRLDRASHLLGRSEPEEFAAALPPLYALYYYAATALLSVPEHPEGDVLRKSFRENAEDLEDACIIEDGEAEEMVRSMEACLDAIRHAAESAMEQDETGSPVTAAVAAVCRQLSCEEETVKTGLAREIADFALHYRMGDAAKLPS